MPNKKFVLTNDNYYSSDRPHISNSQISDYLKSPVLYKKKHVDNTITFNVTPAMKRGLVADAILTQEKNPYELKVLKRDDPDTYARQKEMDDRHLVSASYFEEAHEIADWVKAQPAWDRGLREASFQEILEGEVAGVQVCGLPDRVDVYPDGHVRITDLKVTSAMKIASPRKWLWNSLDMGYIRQAAMYRELYSQKHGVPAEKIEFWHLAVSYVQKGFIKGETYKIPESLMEEALLEIEYALVGINAKDFSEEPLEFSTKNNLYQFAVSRGDDDQVDWSGELTPSK